MTEQPWDGDDTAEMYLELDPDEVPDESAQSTAASHLVPTAEEMAEGKRLGETIDPEDDEDSGVP